MIKFSSFKRMVIFLENNKITGNNIKKYRKIKKITQAELANSTGKSLSTIQKYEAGDVTIPINILDNIAEVLGVSFYDIAGVYNDGNGLKVLGENEGIKKILREMDFTVNEVKNKVYIDDGDLVVTLNLEQWLELNEDVKKYIFFWLWDAERKRDESKQDDLSDDEIVDIREKAGFYGDEYMEELTEEELEKLDKHIQNLMREKKSKK